MNENLGTKGGKRDRKITLFHKKKKKKTADLEKREKQEKDKKQEEARKIPILPDNDILPTPLSRRKAGMCGGPANNPIPKERPGQEISQERDPVPNKKKFFPGETTEELEKEQNDKVILTKEKESQKAFKEPQELETVQHPKETIEIEKTPDVDIKSPQENNIPIERRAVKSVESEIKIEEIPRSLEDVVVRKNIHKKLGISDTSLSNPPDISQGSEKDTLNYLEKEIIHVLDENIKDIEYELKKLDSELYQMKKEMNQDLTQEELEALEIEIEKLMTKIEAIKKEMESLKKTFSLDFPVEVPDNYLIYLVDEYKERQLEKDYLEKKLSESEEYLSLVEKMIVIEQEKEELSDKVQEKKDLLGLSEERIQKLNEDVVSIEESFTDLEKLIENQETILQELEAKVNATVHITERVEFISKTMEHSILELFLLMATLKHNLSLKGNALAAIQAAITLDLILKMTTPTSERVQRKETDLVDYKNMITKSMTDVNLVNSLLDKNISDIASIRYTFLHDYKDCSYLESYQTALKKLDELEDNMKDRKSQVIRMGKDMERQLEKNEAKVKQYGTI